VEPSCADETDPNRRRPDLSLPTSTFQTPSNSAETWIDVSIAAPVQQPASLANLLPLHSAHARERQKTSHFKELATNHMADFQPFVMDLYGAPTRTACKLLKRLALGRQQDCPTVDSNRLYLEMRMRTAIALAKGNALAVINGSGRVLGLMRRDAEGITHLTAG